MKLLKQYVSITLGCALMALAFDWFYAPNELTLGGFTGIAQVINFFVPALPVGVTVIVLNAPLFLMSLKRFGKRFLVRSFFAVPPVVASSRSSQPSDTPTSTPP